MCIHVETFNANKVKKLEIVVFILILPFSRSTCLLTYLLAYLLNLLKLHVESITSIILKTKLNSTNNWLTFSKSFLVLQYTQNIYLRVMF